MYFTRLLLIRSKCGSHSSLRSLLGTLILCPSRSTTLSRSYSCLTLSPPLEPHHLKQHLSHHPSLVQYHHAHQHHHHHHENSTPSKLSQSCFIISPVHSRRSLHTSSSCLLSDGSGIVQPEESTPVSDTSPANDAKPPPQPESSSPSSPQPLVITERCRKRLHSVLDPDEVLRIGVKGGGCSGFEYEISVVKKATVNATNEEEDLTFEEGKVVVDRESLEYMNGAQLDYEEELIRSGFRVVNNPQAEKGCSCGASFALKF